VASLSLKAFHVFFITISVLLAFGFALWSARQFAMHGGGGNLSMALISSVGGIALILYVIRFIRKLNTGNL
jgi:uncharacterized membrane protein YqgA involved in biofilm formation